MYDICIIGGGPAGMSAALTVKNLKPSVSVCIIEKNPGLGKKIYATGNGKCNLSHQSCPEPLEVLKFFDSVGIFTRTDESGRMYPASEQAADVVNALHNALTAANVEIKHNTTPKSVNKTDSGFSLELADDWIECKKLLIATGGKAGPQYGNLGEGYTYSKQLGHHVNRTYPVLSPLECTGNFQSLKGIRSKGNVSLLYNGKSIAKEGGEIQFTEDGLSGICVFNLSRFVRLDPGLTLSEAFKPYSVSVDFIPNLSLNEVELCINNRIEQTHCTTGDLLLTMVHAGISEDIQARVGCNPQKNSKGLSIVDIKKIADLLKNWECQVIGVKGWKKAQCTGGGIPFSEIDEHSGESKLTKCLFFAGELLDYDGPSGGYNLHFAWDSGIKAGKAMADEKI